VGIIVYRSYALYQQNKSYNVLRGTIPDFSSGDIELTFTIDGQVVDQAFPSKSDGYGVNNVTCEDGVTAEWNIDNWGLVNINSNNSKKIKCNIDFIIITDFVKNSKIGDYVKMVPTRSSYSIGYSKTGYNSTQIIYPSQLKIWRIIKKNEDNTIEMISDNTSSTAIHFKGTKGFQYYIGTLNEIAKAYENNNTIGSRYFGYNGQTEVITDTSQFNCKSNCNITESQGGEDNLYMGDANLVKNAVGTLEAIPIDSESKASYYVATRRLTWSKNTYNYGYIGTVYGDAVSTSSQYIFSYHIVTQEYDSSAHLRPIIVLKPNLKATGLGQSDNPWVLE